MNVLELLHQELKDKNWTTEEKSYYIYIRSCELFSYDERYRFCRFLLGGKFLKNEIRNRKIDLENVEDFRVICTSHPKEVYSKLLQELLGIDAEIHGQLHSWVEFHDGRRFMRADATSALDLTRVKMKLHTYGYSPVISESNFQDELKQISKNIHYIQDEYSDVLLEQHENHLLQEYQEFLSGHSVFKNVDDFLIHKMYTIKNLYDSFSGLTSFSDAEFCISYLRGYYFHGDDFNRWRIIQLYQNEKEEYWDFVNLYLIRLGMDTMYFALHKTNDGFSFYEITENDAKQYVKTMNGINKDFMDDIYI